MKQGRLSRLRPPRRSNEKSRHLRIGDFLLIRQSYRLIGPNKIYKLGGDGDAGDERGRNGKEAVAVRQSGCVRCPSARAAGMAVGRPLLQFSTSSRPNLFGGREECMNSHHYSCCDGKNASRVAANE